LELIHCGNILKSCATLEEAGISSGSMIHGLMRQEEVLPTVVPMSLPEIQSLLVSLRTVTENPNFRAFVQKLRSQEFMDRAMKACPIIRVEPAALATLQDPELFISLTNPDNLTKVVDACPAVGRVAEYITSLFTSATSPQRRTQHVSYSMDALSDEEMEMEQGDGDAAGSAMGFQPITASQLAAALANASGSSRPASNTSARSSSSASSRLQPAPTPFVPPPPPASAAGTGLITHEMFSNALQSAMAMANNSRPSRGGGGQGQTAASGPGSTEESLQLMREMGIGDEEVARQALAATNGDVQQAIDLIYSQWMMDD